MSLYGDNNPGLSESGVKIVIVRRSAVTAAVFLALILGATDVAAVDPTATFSLPNPGARSMALGGAFVAQADDATAAFANPAGLVQLLDPEISAELRFWLYSSDPERGFGSDDSVVVADISGVGFLSGVYPIGRLSLAVYRSQLAKFEADQSVDTWYGDLWDINYFEIITWGFAGAYRINEKLSVGLGAAYYDGTVETQMGDSAPIQNASREWGLNGGVLWKPTDALNVGGFFRQGAKLDVHDTNGETNSTGTPLAVPDVFGAGVAWRSSGGSLALLAEWDHVSYSAVDGAEVGDITVRFDDSDEVHVGAEYAFLSIRPIIAVRVGAWYDPAHRWLENAGERLPIGSGEWHGSAGMGLAWEHFQLDFAFDVSDPVITLSVSGGVSF